MMRFRSDLSDKPRWFHLMIAALVIAGACAWKAYRPGTVSPRASRSAPGAPDLDQLRKHFIDHPVSFEVNRGQADSSVRFVTRGADYTLSIAPSEAKVTLSRPDPAARKARSRFTDPDPFRPLPTRTATLSMKLVGANPNARISGVERLPGIANYVIGNNRREWLLGIPTYARVRSRNVYPGIDVAYYGTNSLVEYDLIVAPGKDPGVITLAFDGLSGKGAPLKVAADGDLVLQTAVGPVRQSRPIIYQEYDGVRRQVSGRYVPKGPKQVGFQIAAYDRRRPLVIDPKLAVSSPFAINDAFVTVDAFNNAYFVGTSLGTIGVAKIRSDNQSVYNTVYGGNGGDWPQGVAADRSGSSYITGYTTSTNLPGTGGGVFQASLAGGSDAFVAKLDPTDGLPIFATYLGGAANDDASGIAVDGAGNAYVAGGTWSEDFPLFGAIQTAKGTSNDAFVAKINSTGTALAYSTYLGGNSTDYAACIAVDAVGGAYVGGHTASSNFPTAGAITGPNGGRSGFVTKFEPSGQRHAYSLYVGGSADDRVDGIAVDSVGSAVITGYTLSTDFPRQNPTQPLNGGGADVFVSRLGTSGLPFVYSTFVGGSGDDAGASVAVDAQGSAYVTGVTASANFPVARPVQRNLGGSQDGFVTRMSPSGQFLYSTYLGGAADDAPLSVAVGNTGVVLVTGQTASTDFPLVNPWGGGSFDGSSGFVAVIEPVEKGDLVIKRTADADSAYLPSDDNYQATPADVQIVTQFVDPAMPAATRIRVQNDGDNNRSFLLKATESEGTGWTVTYKRVSDGREIGNDLRGDGYFTPVLASGAFEEYDVQMVATRRVLAGTTKTTDIAVYLAADDPVADVVRAAATANPVQQADLMIKKASEVGTAYAIDDTYQMSPEGDQVEYLTSSPGTKSVYKVKVQNDSNIQEPRTFVLKAQESAEVGWTVVYKTSDGTDITDAMHDADGYTTSSLPMGFDQEITVEMTPSRMAVGNTTKSATISVQLAGGSSIAAQDAVKATTLASLLEVPDLLIKTDAEGETAYASNDVYQKTAPSGDQIETQIVEPLTPAVYKVKVENDGNKERHFTLKATRVTQSGWTVSYALGTPLGTDITEQITSEGGYTTATMLPDGNETIAISITPSRTVTGNAQVSTILKAYLSGSDTVLRETVQAVARVAATPDRLDLLIKKGSDPDTAYAEDNNDPTKPSDAQALTQAVDPNVPAVYHVKMENDGNGPARTFLLKAQESPETGWRVVYKVGDTDITSRVLGTGYLVPRMSPGAVQFLTLEMTPNRTAAGGTSKRVVLSALLDEAATAAVDVVEATTTANTSPQPDLLIKTNSEPDTAFTSDNQYQGAPSGDQVKSQTVAPGTTAIYQVKLENDGNTGPQTYVLRAAESDQAGWSVVYKTDGNDITEAVHAASGYATGEITETGTQVITIEMTPSRLALAGVSKAATLRIYASEETTPRDTVQASTTPALSDRPDLLIKANGDPDDAYAIDDTYQSTPSGNQAKGQNTDPNARAIFQVKIENDGNTIRNFVVRAGESQESGWAVVYKAADTDITSLVMGTDGYPTASLAPGTNETVTVEMVPDLTVVGGTRKTATVTVSLDSGDQSARDSVQAIATANVLYRPDLLVKTGTESDSAYALDGVYQTVPTGGQSRTLVVDPEEPATYHVQVQNDGNTTQRMVVKSVESTTAGWTAVYTVQASAGEAVDVTEQIRADGYAITALAPAAGTVLTVEMKPSAVAVGGSTRYATLSVYSGDEFDPANPDKVAPRDTVKLTTRVNTADQPDLQVKRGRQPDTLYGGRRIFQDNASGDQIEAQAAAPGISTTYNVRIENGGNTTRTFLLRASEANQTGWTTHYLLGTTDITRDLLGDTGFTTSRLSPGKSQTLTVVVAPAAGTALGAVMTIHFQAVLDISEIASRDAVNLVTTVAYENQPDLQIRAENETDADYGIDDTYQTIPSATQESGSQVRSQAVLAGETATYRVRIENDGNIPRTFVLRAAQNAPGWGIAYEVDGADISARIRSTSGYTTPQLAPGAFRVILIKVTADAAATGGVPCSILVRAYLDSPEGTVCDAVRAATTTNVIDKADLLLKKAADPDAEFAGDGLYQPEQAEGAQIVRQSAAHGGQVEYHVRVQNDGNTLRTFVLHEVADPDTTWTVTYKAETTDITSAVRGSGYLTPGLIPGGSETVTVTVVPGSGADADKPKKVNLRVTLDGNDATVTDTVQAEVSLRTVSQADALVKSNGEPEAEFAANNVYEVSPGATQTENQPVGRLEAASFQVKVENDGNVAQAFKVKAVPDSSALWAVLYDWSDGNQIEAADITGAGVVTPILAPGDNAILTVQMTPNGEARGGSAKSIVFRVTREGAATILDSVKVVATVKELAQPDLLIRTAASEEYATDGVYSLIGDQVQTASVLQGKDAVFFVKVENDGNTARGYVLKADGVTDDHWTVTYTDDGSPVTDGITSATGYTTPAISPGGSRVVVVRMRPAQTLTRDALKRTTIRAFVSATASAAGDTVQAITRVGNRPPLKPSLFEVTSTAGAGTIRPTFTLQATDPDLDQVSYVITGRLSETETVTFETNRFASGAKATYQVPTASVLASGSWHWQARAVDKSGAEGPWTGEKNLVVNRPPAVPEILWPETNVIVCPNPVLVARVSDVDGDQVRLVVKVDAGGVTKEYRSAWVQSGAEATVAVTQNLGDGKWKWCAAAEDMRGEAETVLSMGPWTANRYLVVPAAQPALRKDGGLHAFGLAVRMPAGTTLADMGLAGVRAAVWDAAAQAYVRDPLLPPEPGLGLWLRSTGPKPVRYGGTAVEGPFAITLHRGWNLISSPFLTPVVWDLQSLMVERDGEQQTLSAAAAEGLVSDYAWGWRNDQSKYELIYDSWMVPGVANRLEPWRAYWVKAKADRCKLILPAPALVGATRRAGRAPEAAWAFQMQARAATGSGTLLLGAGDSNRALAVGLPPEPPESGAGSLRLGALVQGTLLAADIRSGDRQRQSWDLLLDAAGAEGEVTLTWPDLRALPRDVTLTLVDQATGARCSMRTSAAYTFRAGSEPRRLRVLVEPRTGAAISITGLDVSALRSNVRSVRFTLSAPASVDVDVLSPAGRVVANVARSRAATAGVNQFVWSGPAAPGMYLVRTTATTEEGASVQALRPVVITR